MAENKRKSFLLRIPQTLYDDLHRWAGTDLRSVNAQIEFVLKQAVRERRGGEDSSVGEITEHDEQAGK